MEVIENNVRQGKMFFHPTDESPSHIHGNQFNLCFGTMQPFEKSSERLAVFASIDMEDSTGIQITNDCLVCRFARVVMTDGNFINANRAFKNWAEIFHNDPVVTAAILDRLLHHSEVVTIEGKSFRMKDRTT